MENRVVAVEAYASGCACVCFACAGADRAGETIIFESVATSQLTANEKCITNTRHRNGFCDQRLCVWD